MHDFAGALPRLVEAIFDAAESPDGLAPALFEIAAVLRSEGAHTLVLEPSGLVDAHHWASDELLPLFPIYERDWKDKDPRQAAAIQSFDRVLSDVEVIDPDGFEHSAVYNEHLRLAKVRYSLFTHTRLGPDLVLGQAFLRKAEYGPFSPEHIQALNRLVPFLRRALHLRHLVSTMRDELADLRRALDAAPGAVAILDGRARLVCANAAAERLLAARDGLALDGQKVSAVRSVEAQALLAAVQATACFAEGVAGAPPGHARVVRVTREHGRPLGVVVAPLRPKNPLRASAERGARVLVAIHDPDAKLRLDPAIVAKLHGFTDVEAALACALARGLTVAEFAKARGCTEQTARTHLKRVLEKSGTHRQADLVRALLGTAALHVVAS